MEETPAKQTQSTYEIALSVQPAPDGRAHVFLHYGTLMSNIVMDLGHWEAATGFRDQFFTGLGDAIEQARQHDTGITVPKAAQLLTPGGPRRSPRGR